MNVVSFANCSDFSQQFKMHSELSFTASTDVDLTASFCCDIDLFGIVMGWGSILSLKLLQKYPRQTLIHRYQDMTNLQS